MTVTAPLTDEEARVVSLVSDSNLLSHDIDLALTVGSHVLRNFPNACLETLTQTIETQAAILTALHGPDWHETPEWAAAVEFWHAPEIAS